MKICVVIILVVILVISKKKHKLNISNPEDDINHDFPDEKNFEI